MIDLSCSSCQGAGFFGTRRGRMFPDSTCVNDCSDCGGTGIRRCEDCTERATRLSQDGGIPLCDDCGEQNDRDVAEWMRSVEPAVLSDGDREWLAAWSAKHLCSAGHDHAYLRSSPEAFAALEYVGVQQVEASEDGPAYALELHNCACHSTLCRVIEARKEAA